MTNDEIFRERVPALARQLGVASLAEWNVLAKALPDEIRLAEAEIARGLEGLYPPAKDRTKYEARVNVLLSVYNHLKH